MMLEKIKNISLSRTALTFIAGAIFVLLFLKQCNTISSLKQEVKTAEASANRNYNNYLVSKDSVRVLKSKNGDMISTIKGYEFDIANLTEDQKKLIKKYNGVLNLNKDLNKINSLLRAEIRIKDSLLAEASVVVIDSTTSKINFKKYDDFGKGNTRSLNGSTIVSYDRLNGRFNVIGPNQFNIEQTLTLSAAVEEVDGFNTIKIATSYPGLTIGNIENINLINSKLNQRAEKKAGWSIGVGVGYGINLNNNQVISVGPSIGLGLYWSPKFLRF